MVNSALSISDDPAGAAAPGWCDLGRAEWKRLEAVPVFPHEEELLGIGIDSVRFLSNLEKVFIVALCCIFGEIE